MFHEENRSKEGGMTLSPKASFILGLVVGVLVLCTLGFFILLGMVLKGGVAAGGPRENAKVADNGPAAPSPSPTPSAPPEDVVGEVKPIGSDDHVRGDKNATVTLYEWSDFECPFCSRFHPSMLQLMEEYEGKVKWVYRHFPLSFHPQATPAANASECAAEQNKFWEYADKLFENQASLSDAYYKQLAGELKLNTSKFNDCFSSKKYQSKITQQMSDGSAAGVTGTPGTIIVGADGSKQLVPGAVPYEQLKAMVDQAL